LSTPVPDISDTSRSADLPPMRTATLPNGLHVDGAHAAASKLDQLGRHAADGAGAHAHHDVAVAGDVEHGLRHRGDVVDELRFHLAGHAHGARQRAAVGGDDGRLAGGIHLGQQHHVGVAQHLDEVLEAVARAGVAVRLEGQHERRPGKAPRAAASVAAISTGWWP
jgi:hypothetical protein